MSRIKRALVAAAATLALTGGTALVAAAPAMADTPNMMLCDPATGWCYQTNGPVNPSQPHYCQWDYRLHNLYSGMWYTGCDIWGVAIH